MMVNEPDRAPATDGVKFTLTVQLPAGAILATDVQVLLAIVKSVPVIDVAPSTNATVPVFVNVTLCAVAGVPTVVDTNVSAAVDNDAAGDPTTTATPVPDSDTELVEGVALWPIDSEPDRAPATEGAKLTLTEQLAVGAMLAPDEQVLLPIVKSAPLMVVAPSTSAAVPELVRVTDSEVVAPTVVEANDSAALESVAVGVPTTTATPVPDSDTVLVAGTAL